MYNAYCLKAEDKKNIQVDFAHSSNIHFSLFFHDNEYISSHEITID